MEQYKIKIQFFEEESQLKDAINGGVYLIDLQKDDKEEPIHLYVGESGAVIKRCGEHLYTLFDKPDYFGLDFKDLERNDLTLSIQLVEPIKEKKRFWWDKNYKNKELDVIHTYNPVTQLPTSDRQIQNKYEVVQNIMKELGFK